MRALLTVTHHDGVHESHVLECPHGSTIGEVEATTVESRERYVAGLLARHGTPYGCTCAAETDLIDVYPSIESAIEQITAGASHGIAELDDELLADLVGKIGDARCPECPIAVRVLPLHLPMAVEPVHAPGCPRAELERGR
jgi:hypothetical protein